MRQILILPILLGLVVGIPGASAQGKGNSKAGNAQVASAGVKTDTRNAASDRIFSVEVEKTIRVWFSDSSNLRGLPPGLAKKEHLPPGLQKQLARNGTLPPGLQKKAQPLPPKLVVQLPRLPVNRRYVVIGGNVIILDETTSLIVDILTKVF